MHVEKMGEGRETKNINTGLPGGKGGEGWMTWKVGIR